MLSSESNSWNKGTDSDSHKLLFQFHLKAVPALSALFFPPFKAQLGKAPVRGCLALGMEALGCSQLFPKPPHP